MATASIEKKIPIAGAGYRANRSPLEKKARKDIKGRKRKDFLRKKVPEKSKKGWVF